MKETVHKPVSMVDKYKKLAFLTVLVGFTTFHVHADTGFTNFPLAVNSCSNAVFIDPISDGYDGTKLCTQSDGALRYWDNSGNAHSNQYDLLVSSSSVNITNRYLFLVVYGVGGYQPKCPTYAKNNAGTNIGTSTGGTDSDGTRNAEGTYGYADGFYSFCRYDLGSSNITSAGLKFSTATSSYSCPAGSCGFNASRIFAVYSSASSTSYTTALNTYAKFSAFQQTGGTPASTQIISFTPVEGAVLATSTPVSFSLVAWIDPTDFSSSTNIQIQMQNVDQNVVFDSYSANEIMFYNGNATTSGYFVFSSSTPLTAGNYRITVSIKKVVLYGWLLNPFSAVNDTQTHQFVVGGSTFLGNISQNSFSQIQAILGAKSATSTEALAGTCNLLSGFDVMSCLAFLFVPDSKQLSDSMSSLRDGVLVKMPWGYVTRVYTIMQGTATSSLPAYSVDVPYNANADTVHFSLNMNQAFASATDVLTTTRSPLTTHKNLRDIMEPLIDMIVAFAVMYEILTDIMGSHKHANKHTS